MNSRSSCSDEGVAPKCGVKRGSQFLSQIDPGPSDTNGILKKKQKLERKIENDITEERDHEDSALACGSSGTSGSPKKKQKLERRSENNIPEEREHEANASNYPGYKCSCGWKPTWEDLDCDKTIEEMTKEHFEELYDNYDKATLFPSIWIPGVKMMIPISCPKCGHEIEINVGADADIMWKDDVPDDRIPDIEGFKVTKILIFSTDQSTYLTYQSSEEFLFLCMRKRRSKSKFFKSGHEEYDHQHNCGWYPDQDYLCSMKDEMERQMAYMGDNKNLMSDMGSVYGVIVTIDVTCLKCNEVIEVKVEVNAKILLEKEEPDHRMRNIEGYNITTYRVLPPHVRTFSRDVMDAVWDSLQPDVEDYDYEDQDNLHFDIPDEVLEEPSQIDLVITGKTRMNNGRCVMGLDKRNILLRPIDRTLPNSCCWSEDKNFKIWNRYRFKVLRHPDATTHGKSR